ncbi:MAG: type II secretion system protein, partial [Candidatus Brocadiia bacterium]
MESPHGAARRRGFTLVELLVVISVIVILAALVLPVASSAMKTAARAECTSNLHQVAEGFMIYVKEHRGLMPPSGSPNRNPP